MEISNCDFRMMIFYDFRYGLTPQQCVEKLGSLFGGDEAPSKTMVYKWLAEFKRGRPTFDGDVRDGRPCTSVVAKNIGM
jgi:hypothetical protein